MPEGGLCKRVAGLENGWGCSGLFTDDICNRRTADFQVIDFREVVRFDQMHEIRDGCNAGFGVGTATRKGGIAV